MGTLLRSFLAVSAGSLALAFAPNPAEALVVNVGGTDYNVTTFQGSYSANASKFAPPANGGTMPWFGSSSTLAGQFAAAVNTQLGAVNLSGRFGPLFPYFIDNGGGTINASAYSISGNIPTVLGFEVADPASRVWAEATPIKPAAVPGPLPLFGAAAAFGMSRHLRRRIQMGG